MSRITVRVPCRRCMELMELSGIPGTKTRQISWPSSKLWASEPQNQSLAIPNRGSGTYKIGAANLANNPTTIRVNNPSHPLGVIGRSRLTSETSGLSIAEDSGILRGLCRRSFVPLLGLMIDVCDVWNSISMTFHDSPCHIPCHILKAFMFEFDELEAAFLAWFFDGESTGSERKPSTKFTKKNPMSPMKCACTGQIFRAHF